MEDLKAFQNSIAQSIFGLTLEDAQSKNICINCKAPVDTSDWEPADIDEYLISGLCPTCFAKITREEK